MKKLTKFIVFASFIAGGLLWLVEPTSYLPWKNIENPQTISKISTLASQATELINTEHEREANSILNSRLANNNFLGVSTAVYVENHGTYQSAAGFASKSKLARTNTNTLARIASVTKPMTAVAIMQLYQKGKLKLDVPIQNHLPSFPKKTQGDITIRQLLKHTSGIQHYSSKWDALSFTHYPTLKDALSAFQNRELLFTPGTQYHYSSFGYTILGAIIEEVSQMTYGEYMQKNIWHRAGMLNTSLEKRTNKHANKSDLYIKAGSQFIKSPTTDLSIIYSAGGVQSTAEDLVKFGKAILHHQLVDSASLQIMIQATDELAPATGNDPYGLGWAVYDDPKYGKIIQHGGTQPGCSSFFAIYLKHGIVSTAISNSFGSRQNVFYLTREIANVFLDKKISKSAKIALGE